MVSEKVRVNNPSGLHLRPAGILCKEAMKYKSLITFQYGQGSANAKKRAQCSGRVCEMW